LARREPTVGRRGKVKENKGEGKGIRRMEKEGGRERKSVIVVH